MGQSPVTLVAPDKATSVGGQLTHRCMSRPSKDQPQEAAALLSRCDEGRLF